MAFNSISTQLSEVPSESATFAISKGIKNTDLKLVNFTFKELVEHIEGYADCPIEVKNDQYYFVNTGDYIVPVRLNENMSPSAVHNVIIIDGDKPNNDATLCSPERIHLALKTLGYNHFVYTSFSHDLDAPRWRAIIECKCSHNQVKSNVKKIIALCNNNGCNIKDATENSTQGQPWYFGGMVEPSLYESYSFFDGVTVTGDLISAVEVNKGSRDTSLTALIWEMALAPNANPSKMFEKACEFRDTFESPEEFPDKLIIAKIKAALDKLKRNHDEIFGLPQGKGNKIQATLTNVTAALSAMQSDLFAHPRKVARFDEFKHSVVLHGGDGLWRSFTDEDYTDIRLLLVTLGFSEVPKAIAVDAVSNVARKFAFDSAKDWLMGLPAWDGVPRVERFCHTHFGTEDTEYTQACSKYIWTALAGRIMVPGIQADMLPVLQGLSQGEGKSTSIQNMAPSLDEFSEISFAADDKENARKLRGKMVIETSEMRGFGFKDAEHIKAFVSSRVDNVRGLYKENPEPFHRRCVFFGTTNQEEFLTDTTGNRRYLPMVTKGCDRDAVARDRDQLWAEGLVLFNANGVLWEDAQRLAPEEHKRASVKHPWAVSISKWLAQDANKLIVEKEGLTTGLIIDNMKYSLNGLGKSARADEVSIGTALKELGYVKKRATIHGVRDYYYELMSD